MPLFHAKMRLKSAPQKVNFLLVKSIQKSYTQIVVTNALARFHIVSHPCFREKPFYVKLTFSTA